MEIPRWNPFPIFWIMKCGPDQPRCVLTMAYRTDAGGALLWSTATASWVTCAFTCSTPYAGCWIADGQNGSVPQVEFMYKKTANPIFPTPNQLSSNTMS